jgi:hypothetical protein
MIEGHKTVKLSRFNHHIVDFMNKFWPEFLKRIC